MDPEARAGLDEDRAITEYDECGVYGCREGHD